MARRSHIALSSVQPRSAATQASATAVTGTASCGRGQNGEAAASTDRARYPSHASTSQRWASSSLPW